MKPITATPENAGKLRDWIANRGGIAVWQNQDLGSPSIGCESYTPAKHEDGSEVMSPHWRNGNKPDRIVTDPKYVFIETRKEVKRVKIRRGPPYLGCVHRLDKPRLDAAMEAAGDGSGWHEDWSNHKYGSAWFEAVVTVPDTRVCLADYVGSEKG